MAWFAFEESWRDQVLAATIPARGTRPGLGEIDQRPFWREYARSAPFLLKLGFRVAIWSVVAMALLAKGRRFSKLTTAQKDELLTRATDSRWYLVRQLAMSVKLVACLSYFKEPRIREAFDGVAL